ncbi:MAG TPA: DUF2703 domain-containing protein [bacterium]|nr:DUF2703 domain-containing protein [bacterium]HPN45953.1 DUF2703 domain-containing protein [bacterium]
MNITLELQYFKGCPHAEYALQLVDAYRQAHQDVLVQIIEVRNEQQAQEISFRGSPTILINGRDMLDVPAPDEPRMACRFYPDGLPTLLEFEKIIGNSL